MEIYNDLVNFFGLSALADCSTFPEFISCFVEILFAVCIVIFFFKVVFYTCFRIENIYK